MRNSFRDEQQLIKLKKAVFTKHTSLADPVRADPHTMNYRLIITITIVPTALTH